MATLLDPTATARLHDALRHRARVRACKTWLELREVMTRALVGAVVVEPFDASGRSLMPILEGIRADYPSIPVLLYCRPVRGSVRQIVPLARAGIDELILDGSDDLASVIESKLALAEKHCSAREVLRRLEPRTPDSLRPLIAYCIFHASRNLTVEALAGALGVDRKTLSRRLTKESWPAPGALLAWSRVLLAARLIEEHDRPVDQIALALDYASGTALRNALRRYIGLRPDEIREKGGLDCAIRAFVAVLARRHAGLVADA